MAEENKTTEEQNVQEQEAPQLTLNDVNMVHRIITVASDRGAFKANEMSSVGAVYDKITGFLKYHAPNEEESAEKTTGGEENQTTQESGE